MSIERPAPPIPKDRISVARRAEQRVYVVDPSQKIPLALHLVTQGGWERVLVFADTKKAADELAKALEAVGISAAAVHGNTGNDKRALALKNFNEGKTRVMVSTDMIAKTMNLGDMPHLISLSLSLPADFDVYLDRLQYLGASGCAVAMVGNDEFGALDTIERMLKQTIPQESIEAFATAPETQTPPKHTKKVKPRHRHDKNAKKGKAATAAKETGKGTGKQKP